MAALSPDSSSELVQPKTLQHEFQLPALQAWWQKTPLPDGAVALLDMPHNEFVETEDEINVISGAVYVLAVKYDKMDASKRPKTKEELRKWVVVESNKALADLKYKVEPPFHAWSADQMQKDVVGMAEELFRKTLPPDTKVVDGAKNGGSKDPKSGGK